MAQNGLAWKRFQAAGLEEAGSLNFELQTSNFEVEIQAAMA